MLRTMPHVGLGADRGTGPGHRRPLETAIVLARQIEVAVSGQRLRSTVTAAAGNTGAVEIDEYAAE